MVKIILAVAAGYILKIWVDKQGGPEAVYERLTGNPNTPIASQPNVQPDTSAASYDRTTYQRPTSGPAASGAYPGYNVPSWYNYTQQVLLAMPTGGKVQ